LPHKPIKSALEIGNYDVYFQKGQRLDDLTL
jgi:hypothetical protein